MATLTALTQAGVYGSLAFAAASSRDAHVAHPAATIWIGRIAGLLFLAAAALTLWQALPLSTPADFAPRSSNGPASSAWRSQDHG